MAEEEEGAPEAEAVEDGGGKKKKLMLFGGIGLLVLIIAGAAFVFMGGSDSAPKENQTEATEPGDQKAEAEKGQEVEKEGEKSAEENKAEGEETKEEGEVKIDFGQHFTLKTFSLNLGNPLENRFLKMTVSLEYKGGEPQKKELDARTPQLRDAVINVASKKTREFLLGPDGKDQLRLEMLNRINQYMDRKIEAVFITDIIIE